MIIGKSSFYNKCYCFSVEAAAVKSKLYHMSASLKKYSFRALNLLQNIGFSIKRVLSRSAYATSRSVENVARRVFGFEERKACNHLVSTKENFTEEENAWRINEALLNTLSEKTNDPEQKKMARFLTHNYLAKAAPIYTQLMDWSLPVDIKDFQVNPKLTGTYHRSSFGKNQEFYHLLSQKFAMSKEIPFVPTDTNDFTHLYSLRFEVLENFTDMPMDVVVNHIRKKGVENPLSRPFICDLTDKLSVHMSAKNEDAFRKIFLATQKEYKSSLNSHVSSLRKELPEFSEKELPEFSEKEIQTFLEESTVFVARVHDRESDLHGIKALPIFKTLQRESFIFSYPSLLEVLVETGIFDGKTALHQHPSLLEFLSYTGLFMGGVNFRRQMAQVEKRESSTKYIPEWKDFSEPLYRTPSDFLQGRFQSVEELFMKSQHFEIKSLGAATVKLLRGLFSEINLDTINRDPFQRQLLENTLYKIEEQLSMARLYGEARNFAAFALQIELVHCEMVTLLEMSQPYSENDFQQAYLAALTKIPSFCSVQTGLCKTAVNTFSAVNHILQQTTPEPTRVYQKGFYFEQVDIVGYDHTIENVLEDPNVTKVDLFACQFNPNVDIDPECTHYEVGKIERDIRRILQEKKDTKHLTVCIDSTIDYVNSDKVKVLLENFQEEIENGTLNFVFFRSGMKFDMLGMDNYFGAPYFMINNKAEYWEKFSQLNSREAYRTDKLSTQWYTLAIKYAAEELDEYRRLIFENSKRILGQVPDKLLPAKELSTQSIRVNTIDNEMDPCFFDVKVRGRNHKVRGMMLMRKFYDISQKLGIKSVTRASFGFYHPNCIMININAVESATTLRLHPGINPEENALFIEYFKEIAKLA